MITARLRIPVPSGGIEETVLEIPERHGFDGFELLDRFATRFGPEREKGAETASMSVQVGVSQAGTARAASYPRSAVTEPELAHDAPKQGAPGGVMDTSLSAHGELIRSGRLARQQRALVAFLQAYPSRDWTRAELAEAIGWRINVICGRVNELLAEPFDVLEEVGRRTCKFTGESANALRLKGE